MSYVQEYGDRFSYFNRCLDFPNWKDISVLDFGGNCGNLLRDPLSQIPQANYTCLDVSLDALNLGRNDFPQARWHHYNRWNSRFNPDGLKDLKIPDLGEFELIIACSVFTHTTESEMKETVRELRKICRTLAFTIMTPEVAFYYANKRMTPTPEKKLLQQQRIKGLSSFYLIDDIHIHEKDPGLDRANSFYFLLTLDHLRDLFPGVKIVSPVANEIQHCCILNGEIK